MSRLQRPRLCEERRLPPLQHAEDGGAGHGASWAEGQRPALPGGHGAAGGRPAVALHVARPPGGADRAGAAALRSATSEAGAVGLTRAGGTTAAWLAAAAGAGADASANAGAARTGAAWLAAASGARADGLAAGAAAHATSSYVAGTDSGACAHARPGAGGLLAAGPGAGGRPGAGAEPSGPSGQRNGPRLREGAPGEHDK
mmetsp:Transcript_12964/g.35550  ORF Transcript_12964/g.35550 Transcript_12964/m.35550 type:complete len:201 (+) Transcript_12964:542-1144(+)